MLIRNVLPDDSKRISEIYNYYILNTIITFEEEAITSEEIQRRIEKVTKVYPWIVLEDKGKLVGYAYGSQFRVRNAYRYSTETTIYLEISATGNGYGINLYKELMQRLKLSGFNMALGVIGLPNEPSIKLHEKIGFIKAGHLNESGFKFNKWIDVGFWQLDLKKFNF